jgi:hypothetical protein
MSDSKTDLLLKALRWVARSPSAHPSNMVRVAQDALEQYDNELIAHAEGRTPPSPSYTVAVYLVDKIYGGPEEGGWWYEAGVRLNRPVDGLLVSPFAENRWSETFHGPVAQATAESASAALQLHLDKHANNGRPETSSMLSIGRYQAIAFEGGAAPLIFPATKPHYE